VFFRDSKLEDPSEVPTVMHSFSNLPSLEKYTDSKEPTLLATRGPVNNPAINHLTRATSTAATLALEQDRSNRDDKNDAAFNIAPLAGTQWLNVFSRKAFYRGFSRFSRITWNSLGKPMELMKAVIPDMVNMLQDSPYEQANIDAAVIDFCQNDTTEAILNDGIIHPEQNISYTLLNSLEALGGSFFKELAKDMDASLEAQEGVYHDLELRKMLPRMPHHAVKGKIFDYYKKQLYNAEETFMSNVKAAKIELYKQIENSKAIAEQYLANADIHNNTGAKQKFVDMTIEILTNPKEFLNNPKDIYGGLNWRQMFPKVAKNPVSFFEMLKDHYSYMLILTGEQGPIAAINRSVKGLEEVVNQRHQNVLRFIKTENIGKDAFDIKNFLEGIDKSDHAVELKDLVVNIQGGLATINLDVDIEKAVFGDNAGIKLSPEETFLYQIKFLNKNKNLVMDLPDQIKKDLAKYLFDLDSSTGDIIAGGSIDEQSSTDIEKMVKGRSEVLFTSAIDLLNTLQDENLEQKLKQRDGREYTQILRVFTNFITNFNDLDSFLELTDSKGQKLIDKLPSQLQQIIANRSSLSNLLIEAEKAKTQIEAERKRFEEKFFSKMMSPERFNSIKDLHRQANESLFESMKQVTGQARKDANGMVINAQDEIKQGPLQKQIDEYDKQLAQHDTASMQLAAEAFELPPTLSGYFSTLNLMKQGLDKYEIVENIDSNKYNDSMRFEKRFERAMSNYATDKMEEEISPKILKLSQDLFATMQKLPAGYVFKDGISYANITNQYGKFHLIPGLKNKTSIKGPVRLVRQNINGSFLLETATQVIEIISPQLINAENLGNVFVWDKSPDEQGDLDSNTTKDFKLPDTKPKVAGVLINTDAQSVSINSHKNIKNSQNNFTPANTSTFKGRGQRQIVA